MKFFLKKVIIEHENLTSSLFLWANKLIWKNLWFPFYTSIKFALLVSKVFNIITKTKSKVFNIITNV